MHESLSRRLAREARVLLADVGVLARAVFDPEAPWAARIVVFLVVAYVLSPIDLIPDFIPVLGMLDELLLVPLALRLALRLMPPTLLERYRAVPVTQDQPVAIRVAGAVIVGLIWVTLIIVAASLFRD